MSVIALVLMKVRHVQLVRPHIQRLIRRLINPLLNPVQENVTENELEDGLLQETPGAIVDCKLIINGVCIRSSMEIWRKSSKYVEETHKQEYVYLFYHSRLYDYTPWLLSSNKNFILQFNAIQYY